MEPIRNYIASTIVILLMIAAFLAAPAYCPALSTFPSLGIAARTMTVQDPSILQGAGLRDVRAGDPVRIIKNPDRAGFAITNSRTGRSIQYPPATATGSTRGTTSTR